MEVVEVVVVAVAAGDMEEEEEEEEAMITGMGVEQAGEETVGECH